MLNRQYIVYMATNKRNGNCYIGATSCGLQKRRSEHFQDAKHGRPGCWVFNAALRKYGESAFRWTVIARLATFDEMMKEEVRLIAELKPEYNIARGGQGSSFRKSAEQKAKISRTLMGHSVSEETRAKLRSHKRSMAVREKFRMIALFSGTSRFAEYRHLGPQASSRPVVCLDTGIEYHSASFAARELGLCKSAVIEVCLQNPRRKTVGGLVFRYKSDHETARPSQG
jgi:group I intron endonuclease